MSHRFASLITVVAVAVSAWWGCCLMVQAEGHEVSIVSVEAHCPDQRVVMSSGHQAVTLPVSATQSTVLFSAVDRRLAQGIVMANVPLDNLTGQPERDVGSATYGYRPPPLIATVQPRAPSQPRVVG